ncbi:hypothetical protein F5Y06DRAFT_243814 [Hypoxylon sp. FL0890]|nr:hypothetical protein F5Y06DRAFT_243814 [Hypoxylon sp. FL0890]
MARSLATPTLCCILIMILTGLYGFVKFSHQQDYEAQVNVTVNSEKALPTATCQHGLGLEAKHHISVSNHHDGITNSTRLLVVYAYTESPNAKENLAFFLDNGLHGGADFIFVLNGRSDVAKLIPTKANIQVVARPVRCSDLGVYGEVLRKGGQWNEYSHFIMLGSSAWGPFMPFSTHSCWTDVLLGRITKDVKLVGMTANCLPKFHIQSMVLATDSIGMGLLLEDPSVLNTHHGNQTIAFEGCYRDKKHVVQSEIKATAVIKKAGYKVDALMAAFRKSEDYEGDCAKNSTEDAFWGETYDDTDIHPYETMFMEANRIIEPFSISQLAAWQSPSANASWCNLCRPESIGAH